MDKIDHGTLPTVTYLGSSDDMRILNVLVEEVRGLMPVSGTAVELGLPDPELF